MKINKMMAIKMPFLTVKKDEEGNPILNKLGEVKKTAKLFVVRHNGWLAGRN